MPRILSATALNAVFAARFPRAGTVDSLAASAEQPGQVDSLEAMAVRSASATGKQQWVKATEHFYVQGEPVLAGDFAQVSDQEAASLIHRNMATAATDEEVAAAAKKGSK